MVELACTNDDIEGQLGAVETVNDSNRNQDQSSLRNLFSSSSFFSSNSSRGKVPSSSKKNKQARHHSTFLDVLRRTVSEKENAVFATWYDKKGNATNEYTFGQMWQEAGVISHNLRKRWGLNKDDRVVLCYDFGLHFFAVFLGCLRAGVTPVLVYPPAPPLSRSLGKLNKVIDDCDPVLVLTDSNVNFLRKIDSWNPLSNSSSMWPDKVKFTVTDSLWSRGQRVCPEFDEDVAPEDLAFLQYTSGSTGDPKGVMVTFSNLGANVRLLTDAVKKTYTDENKAFPDEINFFSWLPQYHDMGLVYGIVTPFSAGFRHHMMSPVTFIQQPLLWLELMSRHNITMGVAPDFAYRLVSRKFIEARNRSDTRHPIPDLDLSSIHLLSDAAEPVRVSTATEFYDLFAEYNLREKWFHGAYGLAEHVVTVSGVHEYKLSKPRANDSSSLVACGSRSTFHCTSLVKIVDPATRTELADGKTGEVWVAGPSVAAGYFNRPKLTEEVFCAHLANDTSGVQYLRTGDLAFFQDDYLYICGRIKDLIICDGVNYYPQDVEYAVQDASPAVRPGCMAAFSSDESGSDGRLEVVFEIRRAKADDAAAVCQAVVTAVSNRVGLSPSRVVAIKEGSIPKTTSGKIQRRLTRQKLHGAFLPIVHETTATMLNMSMWRLEGSSKVPVGAEEAPPDPSSEVEATDGTKVRNHSGHEGIDAVLVEFLGQGFDSSMPWDVLGLSSVEGVQLRNAIAEELSVTLSADCFELHPTPAALRTHIAELQGTLIRRKLRKLVPLPSTKVSWAVLGMLQALGVVLILLMFAFAIVPAYYLGELLTDSSTTSAFSVNGRSLLWVWLPLSVPMWMVTFSALVVVAKWLVVGRYREGEMPVPSLGYLRWWWVDRAVHFWEFWIGRFILNTPLIVIFYKLMGTTVHRTAKLDGFVREFDLIDIGAFASVEQRVRCRRFSPWPSIKEKLDDFIHEFDQVDTEALASVEQRVRRRRSSPWKGRTEGPRLRFRAISISRESTVKGMLCPGASIGEEAYIDKRSVVPEGGQVPAGVVARGNPAQNMGPAPQAGTRLCWWKLGVIKVVWLVIELYVFFGLLLIGQIMLNGRLPTTWRYTPLLYWFLLITIFTVLSLALSIVFKWCFIGRRRRGPYEDTVWRNALDWMVDYHFGISAFTLMSVSSNSRLWNGVLMMHGMDIDFSSKVTADSFPPSKADLISVRSSYVSQASFDVTKGGVYYRTEISESSIGYNAHIGPGVRVSRALVPPLTVVSENAIQEHLDERGHPLSRSAQIRHSVMVDILYVALMGILFFSLIPAYEVWTSVCQPRSVWVAVPVFALALVVQTVTWTLVLLGIQWVLYDRLAKRTAPKSLPLFVVYITACWSIQSWSFLPALWGTPLFSVVARFLGAKVKGSLLYLGDQLYDLPYITFADKTIVDSAHVIGHFHVFWETTLGPSHVAGVLHDSTSVMANSVVSSEESGPWRIMVGSSKPAAAKEEWSSTNV